MRLNTDLPHPPMALSDDGTTLAVDRGTTVAVWREGEEDTLRCAKHIGPLALSADGSHLFMGAATVSVVELATKKKVWTAKLRDGADPVTFAATGSAVFFREIGKQLHRVEWADGRDVSASVKSVRDGYFGTILGVGLSRSGAVLGTVVQRRRSFDVVRWRADTLEPIDVRTVDWAVASGRGGHVVVQVDGARQVLDLDEPDEPRPFDGVDVMDPLNQVLVDPTGRYVGMLDGLPFDPFMPLSVWDTVENREVARLDDEAKGRAKVLGPEGVFAIVHRDQTVERVAL